MKSNKHEQLPLVNEKIRVSQLQVVTNDGENVGVITRQEALNLAQKAGLDLVLVAESGGLGVPVAKIIDFGKVLYAKKKKQAEARKHQKTVQIKEIKLRPKIGEHDYLTKLKQSVQFLKTGKHLKITLMFRGREMATMRERGNNLFGRVTQTLQDLGAENIVLEKESRSGNMWSRVYVTKNK